MSANDHYLVGAFDGKTFAPETPLLRGVMRAQAFMLPKPSATFPPATAACPNRLDARGRLPRYAVYPADELSVYADPALHSRRPPALPLGRSKKSAGFTALKRGGRMSKFSREPITPVPDTTGDLLDVQAEFVPVPRRDRLWPAGARRGHSLPGRRQQRHAELPGPADGADAGAGRPCQAAPAGWTALRWKSSAAKARLR